MSYYNFPDQTFETYDPSDDSYPEASASSRNQSAPYEQEYVLDLLTSPLTLNPNQAFYGPPPSPPTFTIPEVYYSPMPQPTPPRSHLSKNPYQHLITQPQLLTTPYQPLTAPSGPLKTPSRPSKKPSRALKTPSQPSESLTKYDIAEGCIEEYAVHPLHKNRKRQPGDDEKWGGTISFAPVRRVPNKTTDLATPMLDCLQDLGLKDPEQRVFGVWASTGKTHFNFRIMWPGYPELEWVAPISIYASDGGLVTKRELARRLAAQYQAFTNMCAEGRFKCRDLRWRVGPGGYTLDRMKLAMLYWSEGDTWQAFIRVLTDYAPGGEIGPAYGPMRDLSKLPTKAKTKST